MNLPNKITLSRILLVPLFLLFVVPIPDSVLNFSLFENCKEFFLNYNEFVKSTGIIIGSIIFIIASATDGVDGYLARKNNLVTSMGKFLDPIADKLLVTSSLLVLVQVGTISTWSATIIIGREFIVTGLRLVAAAEGKVIAASNLGKLKTVFQMVAIPFALLNNWPINLIPIFADLPVYQVLFFIAVVLTVVSGVDYIIKNKHVFKNEN